MTDEMLDKNHYLEAYLIEELGYVEIVGNNSGLEYLARICLILIEKEILGKYNLNYDSKVLIGRPKQQKSYTTYSGEKLTQRLVTEVVINFVPGLKGWAFGGKIQMKSYDGVNWIPQIKDEDENGIEPNHYLKAIYDGQKDILNIVGNKTGLGFFAGICKRLAKYNSNEHWHFSPGFNSLTQDSVEEFVLIVDPEAKSPEAG